MFTKKLLQCLDLTVNDGQSSKIKFGNEVRAANKHSTKILGTIKFICEHIVSDTYVSDVWQCLSVLLRLLQHNRAFTQQRWVLLTQSMTGS